MGKRKVIATKDSSDNDDNLPRSAANARERTRMRVLSKSFERLKLTLPWVPADTKLSKLDTLRLAMTYINHLHSVLVESDTENVAVGVTEDRDRMVKISNKRSWPYSHPSSLSSSRSQTSGAKYEDNNNALILDSNNGESFISHSHHDRNNTESDQVYK